jgi:hypothetical protein
MINAAGLISTHKTETVTRTGQQVLFFPFSLKVCLTP